MSGVNPGPNAKVVSEFEPNVMPVFKGLLPEENLIQLIAYVRSLSPTTPASRQGSPEPVVVIGSSATKIVKTQEN
jgi:hypothetical protein